MPRSLHDLLDHDFDLVVLRELIASGEDLDRVHDESGEPPLVTAARRRRLEAVRVLVEAGADVHRPNRHGKTAWAHAVRRGFHEVADYLSGAGADDVLTPADRLAVALVGGDLTEASRILDRHPGAARTGNPEDDRVLADLAGRSEPEPVRLLIDAGADLVAPGLDGGTPLHQAAWFGQPENARMLVEAGAPLDVFDPVHDATPLHWAAHGSRYSGEAERRQASYVSVGTLLLRAGARTTYPPELARRASRSYAARLLTDASPAVRKVLVGFGVQAEE